MIDAADEAYVDGLDAILFIRDLNERVTKGTLKREDVEAYLSNLSEAKRRAKHFLNVNTPNEKLAKLTRVISMIDEAESVARRYLEKLDVAEDDGN